MDENQLRHLAIVLAHLNDATVDWAEVAKVRGVSRKDNAQTAFKGMMKKIGLDYSNNKFTLIDPSPVPVANGENKSTPSTPRKRKPKQNEDGDSEVKSKSASPKKKAKTKKDVERVVEDGEDEAGQED